MKTSIKDQKKKIRNLSCVMGTIMLLLTVTSIVNFGSDVVADWKDVGPGDYVRVSDPEYGQDLDNTQISLNVDYGKFYDHRAVKTVVSFIYAIAILAFIVCSTKMVVSTIKESCISNKIETYILKMGLCLVVIGISGMIWDIVLFNKIGDGINLVIIVAGIMNFIFCEMFRLARLYKTDSELSV